MDETLRAFPRWVLKITCYRCGKDRMLEEAHAGRQRDMPLRVLISRMRHGYESAFGGRGDTLSGGQRQRIGIARAIIRNSPIMILDEPTAALDTESEHLVVEGLRRLMKGRTVIMIAHRLSTISDADKIVVLKDGVVAEEGTNDELIARGGVYAELHRVQYGEPTAKPAVAGAA